MSIIFNIYVICMKTHRDIGLRCYNFSTCRDMHHTTQQDGETEEQIEAGDDVQYAAVNFSKEKTKTKTTETENKEILYSSVANFNVE
ncbi:hypothetical protein AMELA_G00009740 [Ameiurus melas]|uniref:Uncharacterized protein n=1 Tax=Ameiurus melas TaxID=219545 RepID=A0A7J6BIT5_AMEME|nr:hypothetical protein AMELA_G00009740 [Ameiurus melas]